MGGRRSGRDLERLVRTIEEHLSPRGFTVTSRELAYEQGTSNQIAEFDIRITGPVGSSSVNWLIECRDRPAADPAPNSWIEQLVGRKGRFGFDRVFAVSTTGFAPGTYDYALQNGIYLRSVDSISAIAANFTVREITIIAANIIVPRDLYGVLALPGLERVIRVPRDARFRRVGQGEYQDLASFIRNEHVIPAGLEYMAQYQEVNEETSQRVDVEWTNGTIECLLDGSPILLSSFKGPAQIDRHLLKVPVVAVTVYREGDKIFGAEAAFHIELVDGHVEVRLRQILNSDGTYHSSYMTGGTPSWWGRYPLRHVRVDTVAIG